MNREATEAVYGSVEHGDAEECGCIFCKNFAIQRGVVYPPSFVALLEQLGIDMNKEAKYSSADRPRMDATSMGGRFYFAREMVTAGGRNSVASDSHQFACWFTTSPKAPAFHGGALLAIEFTTHVQWVLPDEPQYRAAFEEG